MHHLLCFTGVTCMICLRRSPEFALHLLPAIKFTVPLHPGGNRGTESAAAAAAAAAASSNKNAAAVAAAAAAAAGTHYFPIA